MKKFISMLVCTLLMCTSFSAFAEAPITVELNCYPIAFAQEPVIQDGRTLVPVRAIFEAMGASVDWNGETKTVTSVLGDTTVVMRLDHDMMSVNGTFKQLDIPPQLIGGSTMVPARAVAESFGCVVAWDGANRKVVISSQDFLERVQAREHFSFVKKLTQNEKTAVSAFGVPYFHGYEMKSDLADGTAVEIGFAAENGYASLSVRSDVYTGEDVRLTDDYVKSVADSMVSVVSGTLVSTGVVLLSDMEFMKIEYTAARVAHGITDPSADITVYMGEKNGVMYTVTLSVYGEVPHSVMGDFQYMINELLIA